MKIYSSKLLAMLSLLVFASLASSGCHSLTKKKPPLMVVETKSATVQQSGDQSVVNPPPVLNAPVARAAQGSPLKPVSGEWAGFIDSVVSRIAPNALNADRAIAIDLPAKPSGFENSFSEKLSIALTSSGVRISTNTDRTGMVVSISSEVKLGWRRSVNVRVRVTNRGDLVAEFVQNAKISRHNLGFYVTPGTFYDSNGNSIPSPVSNVQIHD